MKIRDSEFFREIQNLFNKYIDSKSVFSKLMLNFTKVYDELEMPSRFRSHGSTFEELEALKDSLNMIILNRENLENILLDLEEIGERVFLNQHELKLINMVKQHLQKEKKLKELEVDVDEFQNSEIMKNDKKSIINLVENFSEILKELNLNESIKKIDERRAKEYDKTLYKKVKKIKYI